MDLAPIVLFVYNRPWHSQQTLEALVKNELAQDSILYVFADGAKQNSNKEDLNKINQVHSIIAKQKGFKEIHFIKRDRNFGLADNIVTGVTEIVNKYGKIIVLEDDIVTAPYFLRFLNDGLNLYQNSANVYSINSYMFPIEFNKVTTFLSPLATSSWGWATWSKKWNAFQNELTYKNIIQKNPYLQARFNFADYNYCEMLNNKNSWAIRWYYSVFIRNGLGLFPTKTLSHHIGFGDSATHVKETFNQMELFANKIPVSFTEIIEIDLQDQFLKYFKKPTRLIDLTVRLTNFLLIRK